MNEAETILILVTTKGPFRRRACMKLAYLKSEKQNYHV